MAINIHRTKALRYFGQFSVGQNNSTSKSLYLLAKRKITRRITIVIERKNENVKKNVSINKKNPAKNLPFSTLAVS